MLRENLIEIIQEGGKMGDGIWWMVLVEWEEGALLTAFEDGILTIMNVLFSVVCVWDSVCMCVCMFMFMCASSSFCVLFFYRFFGIYLINGFFFCKTWSSAAHRFFTNNRAYSPKEQFGDVCSGSFCCICCCCDCCCCVICVVSIFDGVKNSECGWLCGWCGCWNWKCCCDVNRSMWSDPVSMVWNWLPPLRDDWIFGWLAAAAAAAAAEAAAATAASRLLRDCLDDWSQLSNILIDVACGGSSNKNNPLVMQLLVKCSAAWFVFASGCDWFGCWLFWDCFATASKIVAI